MLMDKSANRTKREFVKIHSINTNTITEFREILTNTKQSNEKCNCIISTIQTFLMNIRRIL